MAKTRLYYAPSHTIETLKAIISGNDTREKLADELGVTTNTVKNKVHDPRHLRLIEGENGSYTATDDARRLIQLEDEDVLESRFKELPGVEDVLEELEDGGITTEEVGRIISFETGSGASSAERFTEYGSVYARWIQYLDLGEVDDSTPEKNHPLVNERGANNPRVPPEKVIEALRYIDDVENCEEMADRLDYSDRYTQKILTTAYALDLARKERGGGFGITDSGRTVTTTSQGKQSEIIRDKLLEVPLVQAYCNRVPGGEFKNLEVMEQVSEEYSLGWSDGTIRTRAKRLYQWLLFTNLAEEKQQGILVPTEKMPRGNLPDP